jgi:hypothetical protein
MRPTLMQMRWMMKVRGRGHEAAEVVHSWVYRLKLGLQAADLLTDWQADKLTDWHSS